MLEAGLPITKLLTRAALPLVLLILMACANATTTPKPDITPRSGPSWRPQQAIEMIEKPPISAGELAWNAEFDRYLGRWRVTLVYSVRKMYPPRKERRTLLWYVYEDTSKVEGPFK